jgi:hypothetical protein
MRTHLIHGSRRVWRAASVAAGGAAVVLSIGAFGAAPAQASAGAWGWGGGNEGPLVGVFKVSPTTTQVNEAVTPTVVVKVENADGQVDWNYNGWVVLQYAVNRLGAPLPTGNEVKAWHGIAAFPELTFGTVGFGFELVAEIPGESEGPGPWQGQWQWQGQGQSDWNWMPGFGDMMSRPSSPFDIVGQLLTCEQYAEAPCTTQTVSSDGTSGVSTAPSQNETLTATGGGFPSLSCTGVGGVVSFFSTSSQTITVTFEGSLGEHSWSWWSWHKKSVNVCFGSTEQFTTKFGWPAQFNQANGEFEGLLPFCRAYRPAPCISSVQFGYGSVTATIQAPAGDPHITY